MTAKVLLVVAFSHGCYFVSLVILAAVLICILYSYMNAISRFFLSRDCRCPFTSRTSCRSVADSNVYMETIAVSVIRFRRPLASHQQCLLGCESCIDFAATVSSPLFTLSNC